MKQLASFMFILFIGLLIAFGFKREMDKPTKI
jgi:hypothetical protein